MVHWIIIIIIILIVIVIIATTNEAIIVITAVSYPRFDTRRIALRMSVQHQ